MSVATSNMKLIGAFLIKLLSAQAFSSCFRKMAASSYVKHKPWRAAAAAAAAAAASGPKP